VKEHTIEATFIREGERRDVVVVKFAVDGRAGFPDRICLTRDNRVAFAEIKKPGEEPDPRQRYVIAALRARGFRVAVIDQHRQCRQFFEEWLGCSEPT
jgi:hypothetical protein